MCFTFLQVAGERKTEIEELLRGRIFPAVTEDKQQKQSLHQKKHQKQLQDQKDQDQEKQTQDAQIRPKRGSLKQRWRKHQLKKKLSSEDEDSQSRTSTSSSFDEPVLCNGHLPLDTVLGAEASSDGQSEGAEVEQKDQQDMSMLQRLALVR